MNEFAGLSQFLGTKGYAGAGHLERSTLSAEEHKEIDLPADTIRPDGSLDLYEEVQSYFEVQYQRKRRRFILRNSGWVGHIPLNDRYMLEVETRVPVANLERIIARAPATDIVLFDRHTHSYLAIEDKPKSLFDVLSDRFLLALSEVHGEGLLKEYVQRQHRSGSPAGRVDPFRTTLQTRTTGRPVAVFSAFERSIDVGPNRLIRSAIDKLLAYYLSSEAVAETRLDKLLEAREHFRGIGQALEHETTPEAIARYARHLPQHRSAYFDALRIAGYIVANQGIRVRGSGGLVLAPAAVVDMARVFEGYVRGVLQRYFADRDTAVLDGTLGGAGGAKQALFSELAINVKNPDMKPDIVLKRDGSVDLLLDVKYKPPQDLPDRSETEQMACYAARYGCNRVMLLYPAFPSGRNQTVEYIGKIGPLKLYRGVLDLGASDLEATEAGFSEAVFSASRS